MLTRQEEQRDREQVQENDRKVREQQQKKGRSYHEHYSDDTAVGDLLTLARRI